MEYKYKFNVIVIDFNNPYNKAIKDVNDILKTNCSNYVQTALTQTITTNIEPNKEVIDVMTKEFRSVVEDVFNKKNFKLISYEFESCEVSIDNKEDI